MKPWKMTAHDSETRRYLAQEGGWGDGTPWERKTKEPLNPIEKWLWDTGKRKRMEPLRAGWPDLFFGRPDGSFFVVEAKPSRLHLLHSQQAIVLHSLANAGVEVYRYDGNAGFTWIPPVWLDPCASGSDIRHNPMNGQHPRLRRIEPT